MTRIFISHRRSDSLAFTGRIDDRLVNAFDADHLFKDSDVLPIGVDFRWMPAGIMIRFLLTFLASSP